MLPTHAFRLSFGAYGPQIEWLSQAQCLLLYGTARRTLTAVKLTTPASLSILANIIFELTRRDTYASVFCNGNRIRCEARVATCRAGANHTSGVSSMISLNLFVLIRV